jgi:hypothetical protein
VTLAVRIAATLRALLIRPGFLTREYFEGRRASFISPATLYLGCSLTFFLLSPLITRVGRQFQPLPAPVAADSCRALHLTMTPVGPLITPAGAGDSVLLADIDTASLSGRIVAHAGRVACRPQAFEHRFLSLLPMLLFACMPLFAVLMRAVYRNRAPTFAANLVFTLHFHAMLFVVLLASDALSVTGNALLGTLVTVAGIVFTSWQYYAGALYAYRGGPTETMWKTSVVGVLYGAGYTTVLAVLVTWLLLRM